MSNYFQNLSIEEYSISNQSPYGIDIIFGNYLFLKSKQSYFKIFLQVTPTKRHKQILNSLHYHSIKSLSLKLYSKEEAELIELKSQNSLIANFEFQTEFSWPLFEFHWVPRNQNLTQAKFLYTFSHLNNYQNYQNQGIINLVFEPVIINSVLINQVLLMKYQQYNFEKTNTIIAQKY
ncbi:hypothetical protein CXP39_00835 [Mesoplasma syrphidae]|uniref:Uncharacterized protein n=1 Tax=Mesoplasma syrphidae TaxID=225999 RepID=A0A2K9BMT4_9MOLU|nr:hypothetical protein [Mesoplasma syrphidae]AUF83353.1 hypothetical protein CXP39_00835 [Mesoplasma syrphidae]